MKVGDLVKLNSKFYNFSEGYGFGIVTHMSICPHDGYAIYEVAWSGRRFQPAHTNHVLKDLELVNESR